MQIAHKQIIAKNNLYLLCIYNLNEGNMQISTLVLSHWPSELQSQCYSFTHTKLACQHTD